MNEDNPLDNYSGYSQNQDQNQNKYCPSAILQGSLSYRTR